jgi:hypothetical protein
VNPGKAFSLRSLASIGAYFGDLVNNVLSSFVSSQLSVLKLPDLLERLSDPDILQNELKEASELHPIQEFVEHATGADNTRYHSVLFAFLLESLFD